MRGSSVCSSSSRISAELDEEEDILGGEGSANGAGSRALSNHRKTKSGGLAFGKALIKK